MLDLLPIGGIGTRAEGPHQGEDKLALNHCSPVLGIREGGVVFLRVKLFQQCSEESEEGLEEVLVLSRRGLFDMSSDVVQKMIGHPIDERWYVRLVVSCEVFG